VALLSSSRCLRRSPTLRPWTAASRRGVLRGGVLEPGISPCYCRKMTAEHRGSDCTAVKSDGATKEPFSLRRGLGSVAMRCSSQASPGGGRCVSRSWFGQQKGRPSGSPSRVPGSLRPCG